MAKRRAWTRYLIAILFAAATLLAPVWGQETQKSEQGGKEAARPVVEVHVFKPHKEVLFMPLYFAGLVKAKQQVSIYSPLAGVVKKVYAQENESVRRHQDLLALLPDSQGFEFKLHTLKAEFAGQVYWKIKEGQHISQSEELGFIADLSSYRVDVLATYDDLPSLTEGMKVDVILAPSSHWETTTTGLIARISQRAEEKSLAFPIKISIPCTPTSPCRETIRLGSLAKVLAKRDVRTSYVVPNKYLLRNNSHLLTIDKDQRCHWQEVKIGEVFGDMTEILSGIDSNSLIISSYSRQPEEGEKVVISSNARKL